MKHTKKILSLLIAFAMLIGLLPIGVFAASAPSVFYWTHTNDPEGWYSFGSISFAPVPGIDVYQITLYKNNKEVYSFTSWWENYGEDIYVATHLVSELVKNGSGSYTFTVSSCDDDENILATTPMSSPIVYTEPTTKLSVPRLTQNRNGVIAWNEVANATEYYFELDFICDGETFLGWSGNLVEPYFDTELIDGWELDIPPGYTKNDVSIYFRVNASPWNINEFSPSDYTDWVIFNSGDLGGNTPGGGGGGGVGGGGSTKPDDSSYPKYPEDLKWHASGAISFTPAKDVLNYTLTLYKDYSMISDYHFSINELEPTVDFDWFMYQMTRFGDGDYYFTITTPDGMETYSDTLTYTLAPNAKYLYTPQVSGDTISWTDYDSANTETYVVGFYLNYGEDYYQPITYRSADGTSMEIPDYVYELYHQAVADNYANSPESYPKSAAKLMFAPYAIPKDPDTYQIGTCQYTAKGSTGKSGTLDGGIKWNMENGVLSLTGSGKMPDFESVVTPWWDYREEITKVVIGSGITSISKNAFSSLTKMTAVTIPNTVTELGLYAFAYDTALASVSLPTGVTRIDNSVFLGCTALRTVSLPRNLTSLGTYVFAGCESLSGSMTIPAGITEVPDGLFQACKNLTSVTLHAKITKIGDNAFCNTGIAQITLPDSLTAIGEDAFSGTKLKSIVIPDNVKELKAYAFAACYELKDVTLPNCLTTICEGLFMYSSINTLTIPQSVTKIERYAFSESSLTEITLPPFVTELPFGAFMDCRYLRKVRMLGNVKTIGESAFDNCSQLCDIILPNSLTDIGSTAFRNCSALQTIQLPNRLKSIGKWAFAYSGLQEIHIPDSVTEIDMVAFQACKSLTKATLSKGMTEVPQGMFKEASALKEIVIPYGYTIIGTDAFYYCINLKKITIPVTVTSVNFRGFQNVKADIYYGGTEEDWNAMSGSSSLTSWNTIHYNTLAKTDFTEVTVTEDSKTELVISNLESNCEGKAVLCGLYLKGVLQDIVSGTYTEEGITLSSTATAYDEIKVMVWNSLSDNTPVSNGETITAIGGSGL